MSSETVQRLLGVPANAPPHVLLGLTSDRARAAEIDAALRKRLNALFAHSADDSKPVSDLRHLLRFAAMYLKQRPPRPPWREALADHLGLNKQSPAEPPPPPRKLTAFDRQVMALLVGSGGWNAASRSRIVALAAQHGVSLDGLKGVVDGLAQYARSGAPQIGVKDIGVQDLSPHARLSDRPGILGAFDAVPTDGMPNAPAIVYHEESNPFSTIWLSVVAGVVTLIIGVIIMRLVISAPEPGPTPQGTTGGSVASGPTNNAPAHRDGAMPPRSGSGSQWDIVPAAFDGLPTFLGNGIPAAGADAADNSRTALSDLEVIARKLQITDDPAQSVYQQWASAIDTLSTGWVLTDASTRAQVQETIAEVMFAASDTPSVTERFANRLNPPSMRFSEPIDIWRGAWCAGMLAVITHSDQMPPAITQQARARLDLAIGTDAAKDALTFEAAAQAWLDLTVQPMLSAAEYATDTYDRWELWLAAQFELGGGSISQDAVTAVIEQILIQSMALNHPGPTQNILGRMLSLVDFDSDPRSRQWMLELFNREDVPSRNLWLLTSLLATFDWAPWFDASLVLDPDADARQRRRTRDQIAEAWHVPEPTGPRFVDDALLAIDESLAKRWAHAARDVMALPPVQGDVPQMQRLLTVAHLNEAAAWMADNEPELFNNAIGLVEADLLEQGIEPLPAPPATPKSSDAPTISPEPWRGPPSPSKGGGRRTPGQSTPSAPRGASPTVGQPIGADGVWAAGYLESARNTAERIEWLKKLRIAGATDLGMVDAQVFVDVVYRGSPGDVRSLAQQILVEQYANGPVVCMMLLDLFNSAPSTDDVAETISRVTNRILVAVSSDAWEAEARLALLRHVRWLRSDGVDVIDALAERLAESYMNRVEAHGGDRRRSGVTPQAEDAAHQLVDQWWNQARRAVVSTTFPADLAELRRRERLRAELATGPIQRCIAAQVTVLDLMAYTITAEAPSRHEDIAQRFSTLQAQRQQAGGALAQAIEAERTAAWLWAVRFGLDDQLQDVTGDGA
jgi:hypothetical protein